MSGSVRFLYMLAFSIASACPPAAAESPAKVTYLDQGWSNDVRQSFYFTPQGSRMMPYVWFMALERADGLGMFSATANLERYGFLAADGPHPLNPDSLPIGFAIDPVDVAGRGRSVGLTCAACHTANVTVQRKVFRIDGAPAQLDFDHFYKDLAAAVRRTRFDPIAFQGFATRVLKGADPETISRLKGAFAEFQTAMGGDAAMRYPAVESGPGRVDALSQILNALSVADQSDPRNLRSANAPTRYPQLWLTPELEFVQWNPVAASPIGRNGGEVLGVFGSATLSGAPEGWYDSTILTTELNQLESWVAALKPPRWDVIFGPISDPKREKQNEIAIAKGASLYRKYCESCHTLSPYRRTDPKANQFGKTFIEIGRVDYRAVGTDPTYVDALSQRLVYTNAATARILDEQTLVPAAEFFLRTLSAVIARAMDKAGLDEAQKVAISGFRFRPPAIPGGIPEPYVPPSLIDLKAGPLAGIWASGPYLHNGSVPTIEELLSPVAERRRIFWTGGRELDPDRVGYLSNEARGRTKFDTGQPGNHNTGHVYPPGGLGPADRATIIAFLKTL